MRHIRGSTLDSQRRGGLANLVGRKLPAESEVVVDFTGSAIRSWDWHPPFPSHRGERPFMMCRELCLNVQFRDRFWAVHQP